MTMSDAQRACLWALIRGEIMWRGIYCSTTTVAREAGVAMDSRKVRNVLNELCAAGLAEKTDAKARPAGYRITSAGIEAAKDSIATP